MKNTVSILHNATIISSSSIVYSWYCLHLAILAGNVGNMCLKLACVNNLKHACLNMHVKTCCVNRP